MSNITNSNSIYLRQLIDKNVGPLTDVFIDFPFSEDGKPKPIVFVGENGTGKTTLLSNIVDAFYEMAGKAFSNANYPDDRVGYQYFKAIAPFEIHLGADYSFSYITFAAENDPKYILKIGNISDNDAKAQISDETFCFSWKEDENIKTVNVDKDSIRKIWASNVLCYLGPNRYEKPAWMGDKYFRSEEYLHPTVKHGIDGKLNNPIEVQNATSLNLQWLLDVITDSRADIGIESGSMHLVPYTNINNLILLKQARNNLETILSKILSDDVCFKLNYRNSGSSRFGIVKKSDNSVVCPTLDSLSAGQIALFNLFATIVRYADNNNIDQSIHLSDITGIVVIDEIELHLHSKLQKVVLPELIKLFPKIQFVISSHAPLFLLGMKDVFEEDGFDVYELPTAEKISVERFSEFSRAYDYLKETQHYQEEMGHIIDNIIENNSFGEKPLIITEGSTDWKHMKTAFNVLHSKEEYRELFDGLNFEFLEYEPQKSSSLKTLKNEMGNGALVQLCESLKKVPHKRKYIIIADSDIPKVNQKLICKGRQYKKWDNNTYSAILPIPDNRAKTPDICIEHYYSDAEIEKEIEIDGVKRHLFMGHDFNSNGYNYNLDRYCERKDLCGKEKITILDGTQGERVYSLSDENDSTNYALSKSCFADYVCTHTDEFDFTNFIPLFKLIKTIIEDTNSD